jgi:hypothetical protein
MSLNKFISPVCLIKKGIASELRTIFDLIVKMSLLNESFHVIALNEYEARKQYKEKDFDEITEVRSYILLISELNLNWMMMFFVV